MRSRSPRGDSLFTTGTGALRSAGLLADSAPAIIARERLALLAGIDRERILALADVDRQRIETLRDLTAERLALEATIDAQRKALMADVRAERIATLLAADSLTQRADRPLGLGGRLADRLARRDRPLASSAPLVAGGVLYITGRRRMSGLGRGRSTRSAVCR